MHRVEASASRCDKMHHARGNDAQARLLEAAIDLADQIAADAVGLDDGQGALERHLSMNLRCSENGRGRSTAGVTCTRPPSRTDAR